MSLFKLTYDGETLLIHDTDTMEPGELDAMKHLAKFGKFGLERSPKDKMPPAERDVLDDIALEQVRGSYIPHDLKRQAERRIKERVLCR